MRQPGQVIVNRYVIQSLLGQGGMAVVYKVWDRQRFASLAVKQLKPEYARFEQLLEQFRGEADALRRLSHPAITRFYELVTDSGDIFFVMEYVEGKTLRKDLVAAKGPLGFEAIRDTFRAVCTGLHYAHSLGVVHCDLKPENVLIDQSGRIVLSDFGIAQLVENGAVSQAISGLSGGGTPAYMAPEQLAGQLPGPAADIYGLGVLLFEMLTGQRPFNGSTAPPEVIGERARLAWEKNHRPAPAPGTVNPAVPTAVDRVVLCCLQREESARYLNVLALLNDLEAAFNISPAERRAAVPPRPVITTPMAAHSQRNHAAAGWRGTPMVLSLFVLLTFITVALIATFAPLRGLPPVTVPVTRPQPTLPAPSSAEQPAKAGTYSFSPACMSIAVSGQAGTWLRECVEQVTILPDGSLKVFVRWSVAGVSSNLGVKVLSDAGNANMYLTDDLGNRLDHTETGEGANHDVALLNGQSKYGWFLFPAPDPNARFFAFHDEDNGGVTSTFERQW